SVLEALANGAPVLYTTCPALDGLDVTRARQVPSDVTVMRDALAAEIRAGKRDRLPEPAVEKVYGIQAVTNRIDDLYEALAARRRWRTVLRKPRASARPGTTDAGTTDAGTAEVSATKTSAAKTSAAKTRTAKTRTAKPGTAKPGAAKPSVAKTGAAKT